jgi:hypothetical protein
MRRRNGKAGLVLVLLAVAAIMPVTAQARLGPTGSSGDSDSEYPAWATQMRTPYWFSQQAGMNPDDRPLARKSDESGYPVWAAEIKTPYWFSQPVGVSSDDRSLARATSIDSTPSSVVHDGGRSIDFNAYTVTGSVIALLLAIGAGMTFGVWFNRKTRLSTV